METMDRCKNDKIVQRAVACILEAIYEQDFLKCSYGYRHGKKAQVAANDLAKKLYKKYSCVVEADISNSKEQFQRIS